MMAVKVERSATAGGFAKSVAESAVGGVERERGRRSAGAGGTESRGRCNTESFDDEVSSAKLGSVRAG